jgi:TrmH family RNA methyltransferase
MIAPDKLNHLKGGQKRRKLALCFGALERDIAGIAESGCGYSFPSLSRSEYVAKLAAVVLEDPQLPEATAQELKALLAANPLDERRVCNCARNALLSIIGTFPAEWDLIIAPHRSELPVTRDFYPSLYVYAEDIRSPSILVQFLEQQKPWEPKVFFFLLAVVIPCIPVPFALEWAA